MSVATDAEIIRKVPGVCGGRARIRDHRIPVWILEDLRRFGWNKERILEGYPQLTDEDLEAAWQYVSDNLQEIDSDIWQNTEAELPE